MDSNYDLIDELGVIKAQIAELEMRQEQLRDVLVERGVGAYEGEMFRATVSKSKRSCLDMEAVRKKLSPQFIKAHTRETTVMTVRVTARTGMHLALGRIA